MSRRNLRFIPLQVLRAKELMDKYGVKVLIRTPATHLVWNPGYSSITATLLDQYSLAQ